MEKEVARVEPYKMIIVLKDFTIGNSKLATITIRVNGIIISGVNTVVR